MAHWTGEQGQIIYTLLQGAGGVGGTPETSRLFMWDFREIRRMVDVTPPDVKFKQFWPSHRTGILQFGGYIDPTVVDLSAGFNEKAPFQVELRPRALDAGKTWEFNGWLQDWRIRLFVDAPTQWFGTVFTDQEIDISWT